MTRPGRFVWVNPGEALPSPEQALAEPDGLLAAGADLSAARLIEAYRQGIYPWYAEGQPVLWWSPNPRMVLYLEEFRMHRSLQKICRLDPRVSFVASNWEQLLEGYFSASRSA